MGVEFFYVWVTNCIAEMGLCLLNYRVSNLGAQAGTTVSRNDGNHQNVLRTVQWCTDAWVPDRQPYLLHVRWSAATHIHNLQSRSLYGSALKGLNERELERFCANLMMLNRVGPMVGRPVRLRGAAPKRGCWPTPKKEGPLIPWLQKGEVHCDRMQLLSTPP